MIDIVFYMTHNASYIIHICCIADDTLKIRERDFYAGRGDEIE